VSGKEILRAYLETLPALAEALGQIRGLGTRMCTTDAVLENEWQRLQFLIKHARHFKQLAFTQAHIQAYGRSDHLASNLQRQVEAFLSLVDEHFLAAHGPHRLSPRAFFETGTQALETVYDWLKLVRLHILELPNQSDSTH
jgi:hypothetical protein